MFKNKLEKITLIYIGLPCLIFLLNWVHWYISVPIVLYLFWYVKTQFDDYEMDDVKSSFEINYHVYIGVVLIFIWLWFSGVGAFSFQNGDYQKHHAILNDLIEIDWPVSYEVGVVDSRKVNLVYYIAYYLPAALVGKISSFSIAQVAIFIWAFLGINIALFWLYRLLGRASVLTVLVFIFFSGLDIIGHSMMKGTLPKGGDHIEWWSRMWQFSGMSSQLYWVPQHGIVGWILTPLFLHKIINKKTQFLSLYYVFSLLWSPFVTIGLSVYLLYSAYKDGIKSYLKTHKVLVCSLVLMPIVFYYLSRVPDPYKVWLIKFKFWRKIFPANIIFYLIEVGVYGFLLLSFVPKLGKRYRELFKLTLVTLPFYTVYKLGMYNDFCMRGSIPALYVLMFFVILFINNKELFRNNFHKQLMALVLIIGGINSAQEIVRSIIKYDHSRFSTRRVLKMDARFARQYLGRVESVFANYLMPESKPEPVKIPKKLRNILVENDAYGENRVFFDDDP